MARCCISVIAIDVLLDFEQQQEDLKKWNIVELKKTVKNNADRLNTYINVHIQAEM